jgi:hypothetical protein
MMKTLLLSQYRHLELTDLAVPGWVRRGAHRRKLLN